MKYELFLFDLDDTLLDFKESEKLSFSRAMKSLDFDQLLDTVFEEYRKINLGLWKDFEDGKVSKDFLKVERFRKTFSLFNIDLDPAIASSRYLEALPETVVLIDNAVEVCQWLGEKGEIGIITNGIEHVQRQRIKNSALAPFIHFISVSEACGFAKPDIRFFEYTSQMARSFSKGKTVIIGDRLEADIQGAHNLGISGCWFNPEKKPAHQNLKPHYEIKKLLELKEIFNS